MSLSAAYDAIDNTVTCKTCQWYSKLEPPDKAFFDDKVKSNSSSRGKLLRACKENGLDVAMSSFRNHIIEHHKGGVL